MASLKQLQNDAQNASMNLRDYLLFLIQSNTNSPTSGSVLISSQTVSEDGFILSGSAAITFTTSVGFVGTINGANRDESTAYVFSGDGKTLPLINYTCSSGTILIDNVY